MRPRSGQKFRFLLDSNRRQDQKIPVPIVQSGVIDKCLNISFYYRVGSYLHSLIFVTAIVFILSWSVAHKIVIVSSLIPVPTYRRTIFLPNFFFSPFFPMAGRYAHGTFFSQLWQFPLFVPRSALVVLPSNIVFFHLPSIPLNSNNHHVPLLPLSLLPFAYSWSLYIQF